MTLVISSDCTKRAKNVEIIHYLITLQDSVHTYVRWSRYFMPHRWRFIANVKCQIW